MSCNRPLVAFRSASGSVVFKEPPVGHQGALSIPCGQCIGCRLDYSRGWATRCMHEVQMHRFNWFVTLTYDVNPVSLDYSHFVKFMKRLRRRCDFKIRFFMCGEYGEQLGRPHFHALLFGLKLSDLKIFSQKEGRKLFTSQFLTDVWGFGHVVVGDVTFDSAMYVASYAMKRITGEAAEKHYQCVVAETGEIVDRQPEFCEMSRNPGIGAAWFDKYQDDLYNYDRCIVNGAETRVPRYYDRKLREKFPNRSVRVDSSRIDENSRRPHDETPYGLRAREAIVNARLKLKTRVF